MAIASPSLLGDQPVTVEEYLTLGEGPPYYELYAGDLRVNPSPSQNHQDIVLSVAVALRSSCPEELKVLVAPFDWIIDRHNVCQPDVLVARRSDLGAANITVPPLLAVEVLSPSTRGHDLVHKRTLYERAGLASYWLVDVVDANDPGDPSTGTDREHDDPGKPDNNSQQVRLTVLERDSSGHLTHVVEGAGAMPVPVRRPFPLVIVPAQLFT